MVKCFLFCFFKSRPPYQVEKKRVCQRLVCQKREFAARSSSCEVSRCEVSEVHALFVRIDMKHSTYYCLPSIFSVVEIIIQLFVVCPKYKSCYAYFCSCYINFKVANLTVYIYFILMYDIHLHTIYVDMHLKTILTVKFYYSMKCTPPPLHEKDTCIKRTSFLLCITSHSYKHQTTL